MERVIIMGAAGRDFHNFNTYFRDNTAYQVVAFTAAQIPGIANRLYPAALAGPSYPDGIPIYPESELPHLIRQLDVDQVVFAYSDISHTFVMHMASQILACGADFRLMGPKSTMIKSRCPVVAVTAVRTGCGKSQTTRYIGRRLRASGLKVTVIRHPMPYRNLAEQAAQRFASFDDLDRLQCTIEEREEYEPLINSGLIVYAGIDYELILHLAEAESDIIIWDGGNNDFPFYVPDVHIVLVDPHRAGDERCFHPGEANLRMADIVIINKVDSADPAKVEAVRSSVTDLNPHAAVLLTNSRIMVENPERIKGKKVLVIEDGPSITHGNMAYGAGVIAAERLGAGELVDPRPYAVGSIADTFQKWPQIIRSLPAMGYSDEQISELQETINRTPADLVIIGTPIDLRRFMTIEKPMVRIQYELEEIEPKLMAILKNLLEL
jgi:predicted GTPase